MENDFFECFAEENAAELARIGALSGDERERAIGAFAAECLARYDAAPITSLEDFEELVRQST